MVGIWSFANNFDAHYTRARIFPGDGLTVSFRVNARRTVAD